MIDPETKKLSKQIRANITVQMMEIAGLLQEVGDDEISDDDFSDLYDQFQEAKRLMYNLSNSLQNYIG